jgi:hypothetical protein
VGDADGDSDSLGGGARMINVRLFPMHVSTVAVPGRRRKSVQEPRTPTHTRIRTRGRRRREREREEEEEEEEVREGGNIQIQENP